MTEHIDRRGYEKHTFSITREMWNRIQTLAREDSGNVSKAFRDYEARQNQKLAKQETLIQILYEAIHKRDQCIQSLTGDLVDDVLLSVHQYTRCTKRIAEHQGTPKASPKLQETPPINTQITRARGLMEWDG